MEGVQFLLVSSIVGPWFTAIKSMLMIQALYTPQSCSPFSSGYFPKLGWWDGRGLLKPFRCAYWAESREIVGESRAQKGKLLNYFELIVIYSDRWCWVGTLGTWCSSSSGWWSVQIPCTECENRSISVCNPCSVWLTTAASSENSMSLMVTCLTLVFAFRRERLNSLPSVLDTLRCCSKAMLQKKGEKYSKQSRSKHGALFDSAFGCFLFMLEWKDSIRLCRIDGHPIFRRNLKRPLRLTRSKTFVRSINAMNSGICCSWHLS